MKEQFADYHISKMLKELRMNENSFGWYTDRVEPKTNLHQFDLIQRDYFEGDLKNSEVDEGVYCAPLWQQVKQYLWEKYKMTVCIDINRNKQCHCCIRAYDMTIIIPNDILSENWIPNFFDSPIEAEIDGIKRIVAYLYDEYLKIKSA